MNKLIAYLLCFFGTVLITGFQSCSNKRTIEKNLIGGNTVDNDHSDIYQWMVHLESIPGSQPTNPLRAYLWIPPDCKDVKGIVLACHNLQEEGVLTHPDFRKGMAELGFAEIWVTPGWSSIFDVKKGAQVAFEEALDKLAETSGYPELRYAPVVYMGHSAHASAPWHFGAWNPDRTLAMLSLHGDSPLSDFLCCNQVNPDWEGVRNIDGIPGLVCIGEHEWMEERIRSSFAFQKAYPNSTISLLCDAGHWHSDISDRSINYLVTFIKKAATYKMPVDWDGKTPVKLQKLNPRAGWLADRWRPEQLPTAPAASYDAYKGNRDSAFWYFDEEMIHKTEYYYALERGKKYQYINLMQDGQFVPMEQDDFSFRPQADGVTFHLKPAFTDVTGQHLSDQHADSPIHFQRVSGPVKIVNDTTFRVQFYRAGFLDRRSGDIEIMVSAEADDTYRRGWRRLALHIPRCLTEGSPQKITFPEIADVKAGVKSITLNATSDSGLPVCYYINGGPAVIEGDNLLFSAIPPKAEYPVKVSVVAWQYGSMTAPLFQSAEPVERVFYIHE